MERWLEWESHGGPRRSLAALAMLLAAAPAFANDGFFQGTGFELVPVESQDLRVVRERLRISTLPKGRCYPILYQGRPIRELLDDPRTEFPKEPARSDFTLGKAEGCHGELRNDALVGLFHVEARYSIVALRSVEDVQLGFPVPEWEPWNAIADDRVEVPTDFPGAAGFVTSIDGRAVPDTKVRLLDLEDPRAGDSSRLPGYVWKASFSAGAHELQATYDFGYGISADFYEGREYPEGAPPWFLDPDLGPAFHIRYYLTPIRTWAPPPPKRISIQVDVPAGTPVEYLVPVGLRPTCVGERALHFELSNALPTQELDVTFPAGVGGVARVRRLRTLADWSAWRRSLGGARVKTTCEVRDRLARHADGKLRAVLKRAACVERCE